jgi:hypothetical protein
MRNLDIWEDFDILTEIRYTLFSYNRHLDFIGIKMYNYIEISELFGEMWKEQDSNHLRRVSG